MLFLSQHVARQNVGAWKMTCLLTCQHPLLFVRIRKLQQAVTDDDIRLVVV